MLGCTDQLLKNIVLLNETFSYFRRHWKTEDESQETTHESEGGLELHEVVGPDSDQPAGHRVEEGHLLSQAHHDHRQVEKNDPKWGQNSGTFMKKRTLLKT